MRPHLHKRTRLPSHPWQCREIGLTISHSGGFDLALARTYIAARNQFSVCLPCNAPDVGVPHKLAPKTRMSERRCLMWALPVHLILKRRMQGEATWPQVP